jgi:hypothetical protein
LDLERIGGNKIRRKNFGHQQKDMLKRRDWLKLKNIQLLLIKQWQNIELKLKNLIKFKE